MNTAIILAGGVGSRMGLDCPKQFLMVQEKPIISYCFDIFQKHCEIDKMVVKTSAVILYACSESGRKSICIGYKRGKTPVVILGKIL